MKLHFFDQTQYENFKAANDAKAVRTVFLEDTALPSLRSGVAGDIVEAVISAANMIDGSASVQFVLVDDNDKFLDTF